MEALASRLNVTAETIAAYEEGRERLPVIHMLELYTVFGPEASDWLEGYDPFRPATIAAKSSARS